MVPPTPPPALQLPGLDVAPMWVTLGHPCDYANIKGLQYQDQS